MWIKSCYFRGCSSNSAKVNKGLLKDVFFIGLPDPRTDLNRWTRWFQSCALSPADVAEIDVKDICICSLHFVGCNGPTPEHPDPVIYEMGIEDPKIKNSEIKDVVLSVINDRARVMLEHSYASFDVEDQQVENAISIVYADVEQPFRGFNNAPECQLLQLNPGIVISENDSAKLSTISCKTKCAQRIQSKVPEKKKRKRRRKRKSVLLKKRSTAPKQLKVKVSSRKKQQPFTFVDVAKEKNERYTRKLSGKSTNRDINVKIREEIAERSDSDTVSAPSPRMFLDSFSDSEMESFNAPFSSREFVRTTIVKECNLPDNPENDPLSFTSGDFDIKNDPDEETSEHISNSAVSAISFSVAPKEEPEEYKFVPCPDLFGQKTSSNPHSEDNISTGCWSSFDHFYRDSELVADDVSVKQESFDDPANSVESENFHHVSQRFTKDVMRSEVSSDLSGHNFLSGKVFVNSSNCSTVNDCTNDYGMDDKDSVFSSQSGGDSKIMTTVIPGNAHCSGTRRTPGSRAVCHTDRLNITSQKKVSMKILPDSSDKDTHKMINCVQNVVSHKGVSSEGVASLSHKVKRKVFLISSENSQICVRTIPKLTKIVPKSAQGVAKVTKVPADSTNCMSQCVSKRMIVLSSETSQTSAEASQNVSLIDKNDSPNKIHVQSDSKSSLIPPLVKTVKKSPTLLLINPEKNTLTVTQGGFKNVLSSQKNEMVHVSIRSLSQTVDGKGTTKPMIPAQRKHSSAQNNHQPANVAHKKSKCSQDDIVSNALGKEIALSSSKSVQEVTKEIIQANDVGDVPSEVVDKTIFQDDKSTISTEMPSQSVAGPSCVEVCPRVSLNSSNTHVSQYSTVTTASCYSNLLSHRSRYMSTVEKFNKRMRFLSRLKTILGNKNSHPYRT